MPLCCYACTQKSGFDLLYLRERMERGGDPSAGICLRSLNCVSVRISSEMLMIQMQAPARWAQPGDTPREPPA